MSSIRTDDDRARTLLQEALERTDDEEVRRHIREALQHSTAG